MRSIWLEPDGWSVGVIDQTALPHRLATARLTTLAEAAHAIRAMVIRGAPLIGATAGLWHVPRAARGRFRRRARARLCNASGRASDGDQSQMGARRDDGRRPQPAARGARRRCLPARGRDLRGGHRHQYRHRPQRPATDRSHRRAKSGRANGSTCSPIAMPAGSRRSMSAPPPRRSIMAHDKGVAIHVYADETRPRNQGASLTAWELGRHGVPHTLIADNTGGHLMQHGLVDLVIVGTDRVTANGDVCNKIGTYLKALAARDNGVPFYVALPSPTIDFTVADGVAEIPIEERSADEVTTMTGRAADGRIETVRIAPRGHAGRKLRLRRDAGAAGDRPDHRARRDGGVPQRAGGGFSRARRHGRMNGLVEFGCAVGVRGMRKIEARLSFEPAASRNSGDERQSAASRGAGRRPAIADRARHRARHRAIPACARLLRGERAAAAVRPPRRSGRARRRRRNS